jgi:hypothetical protein
MIFGNSVVFGTLNNLSLLMLIKIKLGSNTSMVIIPIIPILIHSFVNNAPKTLLVYSTCNSFPYGQ